MAGTFHVEVITPDKSVFEGDAVELTVPAEGGSLGVLANHAPLVSTLVVGPARVTLEGGSETWLMIGDGFLEVRDNQVKILAELGERDDEIDLARAEAAEKRALERLQQSGSQDVDFARARTALARAVGRIKILRGLKSRGHPGEKPRAG